MSDATKIPVDLAIALLLLAGIALFRTPEKARLGNLAGAVAIAAALGLALATRAVHAAGLVVAAALAGSSVGWLVAARTSMVGIPAMVAFQHGAGAAAALIVSALELLRSAGAPAGGPALTALGQVSGVLGLLVGAGTLSGSLIASGKLSGVLRQPPVALPRHDAILAALGAAGALFGSLGAAAGSPLAAAASLGLAAGAALGFGALFALRIGGADMPVLISLLNATAGLAAAFCGLVVDSSLLVACGAAVAASGSTLTHVMCRAMNRSALRLFLGTASGGAAGPAAGAPRAEVASPAGAAARSEDPFERAAKALREAHRVVIVPGYGMALADAQSEVAMLAETLASRGKDVRFAIHPIAGRMPGHMHVLLAEAEVDYSLLHEPEKIAPQLPETDVALVVGACDVVNSAAIAVPGTPISGMPIVRVHEARCVIVCNLDRKPGYSGVENPLYDDPKAILLLGDAKETAARLLEAVVSA